MVWAQTLAVMPSVALKNLLFCKLPWFWYKLVAVMIKMVSFV